jgi:hypothetical protein
MIKTLVAAAVLTLGLGGLAFAHGPSPPEIITEAGPSGSHAVCYNGSSANQGSYGYCHEPHVYGHRYYAYLHPRPGI